MEEAIDSIPKAYEPGKVENKWYQFWMEKGYFRAEVDPDRKPFTIIMPLPNVTGDLHMGHVCFLAPEDILTRWHRMKGDSALWLPGIDHAGIGAQVVVERMLAEEGTDRYQLGRAEFVARMYRWAEQCRRKITEQEQKMGSSCDWSRERFTLEEGPSLAVRTAFVRLYEKGLIYRGERIVNWCPRCATAISDLETEHEDTGGNLYYVRYHMADGHDYITVATTRPETILGDTAVAVNPDDKRFIDIVGRKVLLPAVNREIPVIADAAVDPEFGTGAVKITPNHDPVDFEVAQRQGLPLVNILNADGTMNENAGPYRGMERFACRQAILADLEKEGLLVKVEPYSHSVGHCQRCRTVIEPIASRQWFVSTGPLARPAIEAVLDGRINIVPPRFIKVYLNWMENIRDWCISRQLWWGHRIPVWYCSECQEMTVAVEEPEACAHCGSRHIEQDPDVLDTWFSSALWPHSTLGWPNDTEDRRYFYPTAVMETGYDILFFWVARMIMMGLEDTGDIPFETVYLHGLLRDARGEKMSKVTGNVLDPMDTVNEYGADALRVAIMAGAAPGNDIKLSTEKLEAGRNFANKLWNATRFVMGSLGVEHAGLDIQWDRLPLEDRWIISRLGATVNGVNRRMEDFQLGEAYRQIYDFLWGEFCDWYIEIAKVRLGNIKGEVSPVPVLVHVLETSLRLLHPYMPFVTEELWQGLKKRANINAGESIMIAPYPGDDKGMADAEAEQVMAVVVEVIRSIRNVRAQNKVPAGRWIEARIFSDTMTPLLKQQSAQIQTLARVSTISFYNSRQDRAPAANELVLILKEADVVIPMESLVDREAERSRLHKEIDILRAEVTRLGRRLDDKVFLAKAPPPVIEKERDRLQERKDKLERLTGQLRQLDD